MTAGFSYDATYETSPGRRGGMVDRLEDGRARGLCRPTSTGVLRQRRPRFARSDGGSYTSKECRWGTTSDRVTS